MPKRPTYKHGIKVGRICNWPENANAPEMVAELATYKGNAIHKSYDSPAGPAALMADEAKCDYFHAREWPRLQAALRQAITDGCVAQFRGNFPSRAWVWINGVLHEARLTEQEQGEYHGFPIYD